MISADLALQALFYPKQIAIYDTSVEGQYTHSLQVILKRQGYRGQIWQSGTSLPTQAQPDVAILALPWEFMPQALADCAVRNVKTAVAIMPGFAETGADGRSRQETLCQLIHQHGLRLLGPNCLGSINTSNGATLLKTAVLHQTTLQPGAISLFSQSGSLLASLLSQGQTLGIGFRYLAATGNEADLTISDFLAFALDDESTRAVALVVEHIRQPQQFLDLAEQAILAHKPIVILKVGRSAASARLARTHTAALVGDDTVQTAVFHKYGIVSVRTPEELLYTTAVLAQAPRPAGRRVAIWGSSGGVCGILSDLAADAELTLAPLHENPPTTLLDLYGNGLHNPLDLGQIKPDAGYKTAATIQQLMQSLTQHTAVDLILVGLSAISDVAAKVESLVTAVATKPVIIYSCLGMEAEPVHTMLRQANLLPIANAGLAVQVAKAVLTYAHKQRHYAKRETNILQLPSPAFPLPAVANTPFLTYQTTKKLLMDFGLPFPIEQIVTTVDAAVKAAQHIGFPVALKLLSPYLPHKTEINGVRLNLHSAAQVQLAYEELWGTAVQNLPEATIEGILIQPMLTGIEVIVGSYRDAQFGPIIVWGSGGIMAELSDDKLLAYPPLSLLEIEQQLRQWRGAALLNGGYGQPPADKKALAQFIVRFSQIVTALGEAIQAIDLNPVLVLPDGEGVLIVDGLIQLSHVEHEGKI